MSPVVLPQSETIYCTRWMDGLRTYYPLFGVFGVITFVSTCYFVCDPYPKQCLLLVIKWRAAFSLFFYIRMCPQRLNWARRHGENKANTKELKERQKPTGFRRRRSLAVGARLVTMTCDHPPRVSRAGIIN
jgi:hypothetical protein